MFYQAVRDDIIKFKSKTFQKTAMELLIGSGKYNVEYPVVCLGATFCVQLIPLFSAECNC